MMYSVSVILPCYDGARWISDAIKSVLAQTYEDFELVIVNDGSTDDSEKIVASYLSDKRVRYICQENKGFSAAINRGTKESSGNLIGFIGQDDLWMPNKLELQVKYFSQHKDADLIHSNYCFIDSEERIVGVRDFRSPNFLSKKEMVKRLFLGNFIGFETVLVKKRCFDEVGFFDERMTGFSDHDMWLRLAGSFNIRYLDVCSVKKRQHEFQLSNVRMTDVLKDEFLMVQKVVDRYPFLQKIEQRKLASLYYALGIALLQEGNYEKAKEKLLKAIRCQPWKLKAAVVYLIPVLYGMIRDHYMKISPPIRMGLERLKNKDLGAC
jgi:glycosyltransferase involved in cell wall biosynthesis